MITPISKMCLPSCFYEWAYLFNSNYLMPYSLSFVCRYCYNETIKAGTRDMSYRYHGNIIKQFTGRCVKIVAGFVIINLFFLSTAENEILEELK